VKAGRTAILGGGAVALLSGIGFALLAIPAGPDRAVSAWFAAAIVCSAVPVGCVPLLFLNHLIGQEVALPRVLEAACRLLPLTFLTLLPGLFQLEAIYPWTTADFTPAGALQAFWLTEWAFIVRTVIYFTLWFGLAEILIRSDKAVGPTHKRPALGAVGLLVHAVATSFAAVDWMMTRSPEFSSGAFGLVYAAHQIAAALAFGILADHLTSPKREPVRAARGMLLAGTLVWAYLAYIEYLTVWSNDLPHLIRWFLDRSDGPWPPLRSIAGGLAAGGIVLALVAGLGRPRPLLAVAAVLLLAAQVAEGLWLALPAPDGPPFVLTLTAVGTIAGSMTALFAVLHARRPEPGRPAPVDRKDHEAGR